MVISRSCNRSGLVGATVAGAVTCADRRELVTLVNAAIGRFGSVRVLIRLERYMGPDHDGRFDPDALWDGAATGISKIAIIGQPAWKTLRPATGRYPQVPIEYFATEQAARCWLAERRRSRRTGRRANDTRAAAAPSLR